MNRALVKFSARLFLIALTIPGLSVATPYSNMFVLGDSLSDVGNLFIATSLPGPPVPQESDYFQGRFSNGPIYAEHLWQQLGLPGDLSPSLANGTNYAVGGARSRYHASDFLDPNFDPLTDTTAAPSFFNLLGQRDELLDDIQSLDTTALYTVWIGSNDVADAFEIYLGGSPSDAAALLERSADDLIQVINDLVVAGAEDFLVPNVPNLGLVPEVQALLPTVPPAQQIATQLSQDFNALVDLGLAGIAADIARLDTFQFLTDLVADPTLFGLPPIPVTNVKQACIDGSVGQPSVGPPCGNPDNYVFWDKIHPTAVTHDIIGSLAAVAVPEPMSFLLLTVGLAGIGYRRHRSKKAV